MKNVRRRMTPQPVKIRADVELTCFAYDGVLALQVHFQHRRGHLQQPCPAIEFSRLPVGLLLFARDNCRQQCGQQSEKAPRIVLSR